jgi:hypothetical protein
MSDPTTEADPQNTEIIKLRGHGSDIRGVSTNEVVTAESLGMEYSLGDDALCLTWSVELLKQHI